MTLLLDDILNCYDELFANSFASPIFVALAIGSSLIIILSLFKRRL